MISHEFDLYCNAVALDDPPYHEQLLIMQQFEETREATLKQQGAIDALERLSLTLSRIIIRDDVRGDYLIVYLCRLSLSCELFADRFFESNYARHCADSPYQLQLDGGDTSVRIVRYILI